MRPPRCVRKVADSSWITPASPDTRRNKILYDRPHDRRQLWPARHPIVMPKMTTHDESGAFQHWFDLQF
jgi:hypothetical protein